MDQDISLSLKACPERGYATLHSVLGRTFRAVGIGGRAATASECECQVVNIEADIEADMNIVENPIQL